MLYEFLFGTLPFGFEEDDIFEVYQEILRSELSFPEEFSDEVTKDLITVLLQKHPLKRVNQSIYQLKVHK